MAAEALPKSKRVEIIDKKEFALAVLILDNEIFVMHVAALAKPIIMLIHPSCQAQIALLKSEKIGIPVEYSYFSNVFFSDSVAELLEWTKINDHPINLLDDKQQPYGPIYGLGAGELETFKTYIKANLASGFIRPSKFPSSTPIPFLRKNDGSHYLCIDYQRLNNLIIKNHYLLPLIGKLLECLG